MPISSALLVVALGLSQTAPSAKAPMKPVEARKLAKADLEKMQGTWIRVKMIHRGEELVINEEWTATYTGDILNLRRDGEVYQSGSIVTLDPSQKPKAMNTWNTEGEGKDKTLAGIYQIDGDTMKVCFALPGDARPKEFTTKSGTGFLYVEYKLRKN